MGARRVWIALRSGCVWKRNATGGLVAATWLLGVLSGCAGRFVATTITNETDKPLKVVELDYPGAGFGVSTLAPHEIYSYRFKAIGSGPLTLSYSDAGGTAHTATGPPVQDGQGGHLNVRIRERGAVSWEPAFNPR